MYGTAVCGLWILPVLEAEENKAEKSRGGFFLEVKMDCVTGGEIDGNCKAASLGGEDLGSAQNSEV